jgi:hypothetical protein
LRRNTGSFDCILLDVDNGPSAMSAAAHQQLYETRGIAWMKSALRPGGTVVIWSAGPDAAFLKRLGKAGLEARVERSAARLGGSASHVLFVGTLSAARRRSER